MVLVTFVTITKKVDKIEFPPDATIKQMKEKYTQDILNSDNIKIIKFIFNRSTPKDTDTIQSLGIDNNSQIIVHAPRKTAQTSKGSESKPPHQTLPKVEEINVAEPPEAVVIPPANSRFELMQNIDRFLTMDLDKEEFEGQIKASHGVYLVATENKINNKVFHFSANTSEQDEELRHSIIHMIFRKMMLLNKGVIENFIRNEEKLFPVVRKNPEAILRYLYLRNDGFDLDGVMDRTLEPLSDDDFLALFNQAKHITMGQLMSEVTKKIHNETPLEKAQRFLNHLQPNEAADVIQIINTTGVDIEYAIQTYNECNKCVEEATNYILGY